MILITGASGLVGGAIFDRLSHYPGVMGTSYTSEDRRFLKLDLTDEDSVRSLFKEKGIEACIHCAASFQNNLKDVTEIEIYKRNISMAVNILKNIDQNVFFINISSAGIYNLKGAGKLKEGAAAACSSLYKLSKKHVEDLLGLFYTGTNRFLNIRISSPYSVEKESDTVLYKFIKAAVKNNAIHLWGSGRRTQSFTNVESLAESINQMYDRKLSGNFNYVTTRSVSMLELARIIKKYRKDLVIERSRGEDPEEWHRTAIDNSKVSKCVTIEDTIERDISKIIERLSV